MRISTLDSIRIQFQNPRDQLLEMLKTWLTTSDNTSWKSLTDALRSRSVGAGQLASVLETKYCLERETEVDSATSICDTNVTPPPPLSEQMLPQPGVAGTQTSKWINTHLNNNPSPCSYVTMSPPISPGPSPQSSSITGDSTPPETCTISRPLTVTTHLHPSLGISFLATYWPSICAQGRIVCYRLWITSS